MIVKGVAILNFVSIQNGHIVPALSPEDDPWIELVMNIGASKTAPPPGNDRVHVIISKDLKTLQGVEWGSHRSGLPPNGTRVVVGDNSRELRACHMPEIREMTEEALRNL